MTSAVSFDGIVAKNDTVVNENLYDDIGHSYDERQMKEPISESEKASLVRFGQELSARMEKKRIGPTLLSSLSGKKVSASYISDICRVARGNSDKLFRISRLKVEQIALAMDWPVEDALKLAGFAVAPAISPEPSSRLTAEQALATAFYFQSKGLSESDIEALRPLLEGVDQIADRLARQ